MRILIIEDNQELSLAMKDGLAQYGFTCDIANLGLEGEEKAFANEYDGILLDLNLPDKDGFDILRFLRQENIQTPILIVSAREEISQRALGLNLGADDYLVKPFDFLELSARINATNRRFYGRAKSEIVVGGLVLYPQERKGYYEKKELPLSAKEFDVLEFIASSHPKVVSSEEISEHVYDEYLDPFSSVLRVHIANLRKKLKQVSTENLLITHKGKGYCLWDE